VKGYLQGYVGIDDFSMSPECFGLGKQRIIVIYVSFFYLSLLRGRELLERVRQYLIS
jgi:hypothetical protein